MIVKIIKVGTSKGIIIPKTILNEVGVSLGDTLVIELQNQTITLSKPANPHQEFEDYIKNNPQNKSSNDWTW